MSIEFSCCFSFGLNTVKSCLLIKDAGWHVIENVNLFRFTFVNIVWLTSELFLCIESGKQLYLFPKNWSVTHNLSWPMLCRCTTNIWNTTDRRDGCSEGYARKTSLSSTLLWHNNGATGWDHKFSVIFLTGLFRKHFIYMISLHSLAIHYHVCINQCYCLFVSSVCLECSWGNLV